MEIEIGNASKKVHPSRLFKTKKLEACVPMDGLHRRKEGISETSVGDMLHLQF